MSDVSPPVPDPLTLMRLCEDLARAAGRHVRARAADHGGVARTKSSAVDVVTAVDTESEALLRERIGAARPCDGILGEEEGSSTGTSGLTWVLDPIDGTVNFLYGIPSYAVSVAVVSGPPDPAGWTQLAGCVHSVTDGVTWTAARGEGAWRDGVRIGPRTPPRLGEALVGTGFSYSATKRGRQGEVVARLLPHVRDIRRIGSAAIDLCHVADGRLDAFFENGLNPWDMAAGGLVALEAGGVVQDLDGGRPRQEMTVAGPPALVPQLAAALTDAGAAAV